MAQAKAPLRTELKIDRAKPKPKASTGWGLNSRCTAAPMMARAATKMRTPSNPLEKYSALWWPKGWSSSAGCCATVTMARANIAPARLTRDSIASDNRLTESVSHQAPVFKAIVSSATATESFR